MGVYELDDELVRGYVRYPSRMLAGETAAALQARLSEQLPLEVPTKLGAVVRTERGTAVRHGLGDDYAWTLWPDHPDDSVITHTLELGRITRVFSEGVDVPDTDT